MPKSGFTIGSKGMVAVSEERKLCDWKSLFTYPKLLRRIWGSDGNRNSTDANSGEPSSGEGYVSARAEGDSEDGIPWELR